jgi:hypothetical protein
VAKLTIALCIVLLWTGATIAQPSSLDDVSTTRAVVTGTDERNRPLGFKLCFEELTQDYQVATGKLTATIQ